MNNAISSPTISIAMPCYNGARHLPLSVGSVQAQTRADWELIVVDDGSNDDSWKTLQGLAAADARVRIFRQANAGAAAARNHGLREVRGRYTAFLDSDDTWDPHFLESMVAALESEPDAGIAYCGWQNLGVAGGRGAPFIPPDYENQTKLEALLEGCRWPIHGALTRSELIQECGGFDETLSSCMDYDLWLRLGTSHRLALVPQVLAYYHHHAGEQITKNGARIALNHWRAQRKFLEQHADARTQLGERRIRDLTDGGLLQRGYAAYWKRDLPAARKIFRRVMTQGYGGPKDWLYMLPCLLPEILQLRLIKLLDSRSIKSR